MSSYRRYLLVLLFLTPKPSISVGADNLISAGRAPDPTAKKVAEIRAAEKRRIPLEVMVKVANHYPVGGPVEVTVMVTNLFEAPLLMNGRMLVNHPRLQGELAFRILGPDGKKVEIQRLITPLSIRDEDYVTLTRGQSMQRTVNLTDLYGVSQKGVYKLQVSYHNEVDQTIDGRHAWKGIVSSDPLEIQLE